MTWGRPFLWETWRRPSKDLQIHNTKRKKKHKFETFGLTFQLSTAFSSFCLGLYCFLLCVRVCVVTKMRGKCAWARPYTCQQKNIWNLQLKTENRIVTKKKNCWICFLIVSGSDVIFLKGLCRYYHSEAGYGLIHLSLPLLWPFVYKNKFMNLKWNILIHCCHQVVIVWHRSFSLIVTVFLVLDDIQIMGIQSLPWQSWTTKIYFFIFLTGFQAKIHCTQLCPLNVIKCWIWCSLLCYATTSPWWGSQLLVQRRYEVMSNNKQSAMTLQYV